MAEESDKRWASRNMGGDIDPMQTRGTHGATFDRAVDDAGVVRESGVDPRTGNDLPGDVLFDALNDSLDDVIVLLEREIERLKSSLEIYRDSEHPNRRDIMRMHVDALDRRQDTLDEMRDLVKQAG